MLPRTGRPKRSAMGVSGTNRPATCRPSMRMLAILITGGRHTAASLGLEAGSMSRSCPTGSAGRPRASPRTCTRTSGRSTPPRQPDRRPAPAATLCRGGRGGDPVFSPRSTPGLPRVPRCSRRCCSGTGSKNTATVLNTSATPPMKRACPGRPVPWVKTTVNQPRAPLVLSRSHGAAGYANRSVSAIARIGADPQHPVRGIPGQVAISSWVMPDMAAPAIARASRFRASTSSSWARW